MADHHVADVLLLLPLAQLYTYSIPERLRGKVRRGVQVDCPVRTRRAHGLVLKVRPPSPADPPLVDVAEVVTTRPPWPEDLLELLDFVSTYYVARIGQVARAAMPSLFARRSPKPEAWVRIATRPDKLPRSPKDVLVLEAVEAAGRLELPAARVLVPGGADVVKRLLARGFLAIEEEEATPAPAPAAAAPVVVRPEPTTDQAAVLAQIGGAIGNGYKAFLLHGVTGSGKTEVYFRAIEQVVAAGRGAIVLVPEIALTVELRRHIEARFGGIVAVLHSAMAQGQRAAAWDAALAGRMRIVVGPRSAVFAPVRDLGLVVVDEEHETTYKQEEGLRYNARDVAMVRAKMAGCPVVLGSATPSLETFQNAHAGKVTYLSMPHRVRERPMPEVRFVDLRYEPPVGAERLFSRPLLDALSATIGRGESAILFINRRGFGRFVVCSACGAPISCPNCSITLTHHVKPDRLACHYCDHQVPVPERCPGCGSSEVAIYGFGTERVEDEVGRLVRGVRCARLDADTASAGGIDAILAGFRRGDSNVLVGTQIVAKGHDFPMVTLVGVLLAEQSLAFPDFRAAERTFQLLTQVAGRAGRGETPGQVVIQTFEPGQYALRFAAAHDFLGFAVVENRIRRERGYPPHSHLAAIEVSSPDPAEASRAADEVRDYLDQFLTLEGAGTRGGPAAASAILGPALAAIERIKGRTRMQVLVKTRRRAALNRALWRLYKLVGPGRGRTRIRIDVDPVSLL
ncbi:MAG: primosomal protein N' [Deltaproteobacteria bacterium]|nr:primosomal protein N' [Deltaproteobacteria bacterium]